MSAARCFACTLAALAVVCGSMISTAMAASYSTGFEEFTLGPMSSGGVTQNGWSGGAQPDFTNNDAGDEQIVNTVVHSGAQSWHYARGYNSPGQGTPYTPNIGDSVNVIGDTMAGSLWFKAHTAADNSLLAIETGNLIGDDRAEILAYIDNVPGGITVRSFTGSGFSNVPIASGLDASIWHELSYSLSLNATDLAVSISVDGAAAVQFDGSLKDWRDANSFAYSESSRLKFRARHADGNPLLNGFYIDDVSYSISAVPEPATVALAGLASIGMLAARRRQRQA